MTQVYNEVFSQHAILHPAEKNASYAATVSVKVAKTPTGTPLSGYFHAGGRL
jgi:hypothetical protein